MAYIDRDKAVSFFENHRRIGLHKDDIVAYLSSLPTADVAEVKHGEWILHDDGSGTCTLCGKRQKHIWDMDNWQNFCGHCGACMDGGKAE